MVELCPGEALYLPSYTYHHVFSTGEPSDDALDDMLNVAVNAWFPGDARFGRLFSHVLELMLGGAPEDAEGLPPVQLHGATDLWHRPAPEGEESASRV